MYLPLLVCGPNKSPGTEEPPVSNYTITIYLAQLYMESSELRPCKHHTELQKALFSSGSRDDEKILRLKFGCSYLLYWV